MDILTRSKPGPYTVLETSPRYSIALAVPVTCEPGPVVGIMVEPGRVGLAGLANAQGLYQFLRVCTAVAQTTLGFVEFGVPPATNGLLIRNVLALPPAAVDVLGVTANGLPV